MTFYLKKTAISIKYIIIIHKKIKCINQKNIKIILQLLLILFVIPAGITIFKIFKRIIYPELIKSCISRLKKTFFLNYKLIIS